jgi:hypothetical protein
MQALEEDIDCEAFNEHLEGWPKGGVECGIKTENIL